MAAAVALGRSLGRGPRNDAGAGHRVRAGRRHPLRGGAWFFLERSPQLSDYGGLMPGLPTGTVTFLSTDIEGSTRLLQQLGDRYTQVLAAHHRLLRTASPCVSTT